MVVPLDLASSSASLWARPLAGIAFFAFHVILISFCKMLVRSVRVGRQVLLPRTRPRLQSSTTATATEGSSTAGAAKSDEDTRPFFIRNPITTFFLSAGAFWAYSLYVGNRSRKERDELEDQICDRMPASTDEQLELRSDNSMPPSTLASLRTAAAKAGYGERVPREKVVELLRGLASEGQPLKHEFVIERLIMSLPDLPDADASGRLVDLRLALGILAFLPSGTTRERFELMFNALGDEVSTGGSAWMRAGSRSSTAATDADSPPTIDAAYLAPLLSALMCAGQMPIEKMVVVEDAGKNAIGMGRNWYTIEHSREMSAEELAHALLRDSVDDDGAAAAAGDLGAGATTAARERGTPSRIELERFVAMLQSERACIWRECFHLADLKRVRDKAEAAEKAALEPPFYTRWWNWLTGAGPASA